MSRKLNLDAMEAQFEFTKNLNRVTNKIHATTNINEIILDVSKDICALFNADRLTIYLVSDDKTTLISKIKTGLNSFKDIQLPIDDRSIAGYVAVHKKLLNLKDVYDSVELQKCGPSLRFLPDVDKRTGYRTKQMLVAPIVDADSAQLIGVIQLINNKNGQPFPSLVESGVVELATTLAIALQKRWSQIVTVKTKYDSLVSDAVISAAEFELATQTARRKSLDIEDVLLDEFQVKPDSLGKALSYFFGVPYEAFKADRVKPIELLRNFKREYLESEHWLPIETNADTVIILTPDPERTQASGVVRNIFPKHRLIYKVSLQRDFKSTLDLFYGGRASEVTDDLAVNSTADDLHFYLGNEDAGSKIGSDEVSAAADNKLVRLVNKIIIDAYKMGASDIHIEPQSGKAKTLVRLRKDGSLLNYIEVPASYRNALVTRLKIMCDLDISEKRKPQDGKIKFKKYGPLDIELRVVTIPSQDGLEDVVLRILSSGEPIPLDKMNFSRRNLELIKTTISKPYGLFFVCGPTGSGKTTTLHSILKHINTPETKIWTAEDPVEITQKGLRQVQINKKAGLDFATIMRSFLRADPDVIMVGEMRDKETVAIGIEASLTGHLVFSTLHTNSAPESINRLLDMGMDPFNFADALLGVLAQRLAKRLCPDCKKSHVASPEEVNSLLLEYAAELIHTPLWQENPKASEQAIYANWIKLFGNEQGQIILYERVGCEKCSGTGYRGRVGLHELLIGSDSIKQAIQAHLRVADILAIALNEGMHTLKQDGIEKVLMGITDIHQVRSVCIK